MLKAFAKPKVHMRATGCKVESLRGASAFARKIRRGFNLVETSLAIGIGVLVLTMGAQLGTEHLFRKSLNAEADQISVLAAAAKEHVLLDLNKHITQARANANNIIDLPINDLNTTETYSLVSPRTTLRRRTLSVFLWAPTSTSLMVVTQAQFPSGEVGRVAAVRSPSSTAPIGWVPPYALNRLEGTGIYYDITHFKTAGRSFKAGDFAALEYLSIDRDVSPYLHRTFNAQLPNLNKMETSLDLGGHNITNVGTLTATEMAVKTALTAKTITGAVTVTGEGVFGASVNVTGDVNIEGNATITGATKTDTLTVGQNITTGALSSTGATFTTLQAVNVVSTGTFNSVKIDTTDLTTNNLTATTGTATRLEAVNLFAGSTLKATSVATTTLNTGSCTGC